MPDTTLAYDPATGLATTVTTEGTVVGQYGQVFDGFARVRWATAGAGDATVLGSQAPDVTESFAYDLAGRLTRVQQNGELYVEGSDRCRIREYGFNDRSDKPTTRFTAGTITGDGSQAQAMLGCAPDGDAQVVTRTFNTASQVLTTSDTAEPTMLAKQRAGSGDDGYVYDAWGRVVYTPSSDSPTGTPTGLAYYADDSIAATVTAQPQQPSDTAKRSTATGGQRGDVGDDTTALSIDPVAEVTWDARVYGRDPLGHGRSDTWTTSTLTTSGQPDTPTAAAAALQQLFTHTDKQQASSTPDVVQHYASAGSDSPTWVEHAGGDVEQWLPAPDGTIAVTVSATAPGGGSVPLVDPHGDNTITVPLAETSSRTLNHAPDAESDTTASYVHYDEYGNPQTPPETGEDNSDTTVALTEQATGGNAWYGYLATWQRPRQDPSGLTLMGTRVYNPVTGTFTTTDPIPSGNTNPYTYPTDPVNQSDPSGLNAYTDKPMKEGFDREGRHWIIRRGYYHEATDRGWGFDKAWHKRGIQDFKLGAISYVLRTAAPHENYKRPNRYQYHRRVYEWNCPNGGFSCYKTGRHVTLHVVIDYNESLLTDYGGYRQFGMVTAFCRMPHGRTYCPRYVTQWLGS